MNEPRKPITDCFLIIDTLGNVATLDAHMWYDMLGNAERMERVKVYARELNLKQMNQVIREYRKGNIKFGDKQWIIQ